MKKNFLIILTFALTFVLIACSNNTDNKSDINYDDLIGDSQGVVVYFFWSSSCPVCTRQKPYLEDWDNKYSGIEIKAFEVSRSENVDLLKQMAEANGFQARGVPITFIGDKYWVGFSDAYAIEMENTIKRCSVVDCINPFFN